MTSSSRWIYAVCFMLAATGFLMPLWPLSVLGVVLCAASGRFIFAVLIGLLLDLAWGAPTGLAHFLYFPFTALGVAAALARYWGGRYFFDRGVQERV